MIRDTSGIVFVDEAVRIPLAVDALVVMTDDPRDLGVLVHMSKDALADCRVLLHLAALIER